MSRRPALLMLLIVPWSACRGGELPPPKHFLEVLRTPHQPQVLQYHSQIYGDLQRFGFCATDFDDQPKPLIVELMPGAYGNMQGAARQCARICRIAADAGKSCVVVRPGGLGNGTVYQGFGEVDVYDVIDLVAQIVPIDRDRITATGASMGGAAAWFHASHYPDVWAAAAPFCGYCDYQLWKKPGGTTFHRSAWEEFSWIARGASYRVGNLRHVPIRMIHGEWDRSVGGGVDVEHSRSMARKLDARGFTYQYDEVAQTGHGCRTQATLTPTIHWLLEQKKTRNPAQTSLTVHTLRHNRDAWLEVEQQMESGRPSSVEGERSDRGVVLATENVARLEVGPTGDEALRILRIDDQALGRFDFSTAQRFARTGDGAWEPVRAEIPRRQKQPGLAGPLGDVFFAPLVIVYGDSGSPAASHYNSTMAHEMARFFRHTNGGVHRGGIPGDIDVHLPIVSDKQLLRLQAGSVAALADEGDGSIRVDRVLLERANLLLIGHPKSNAVLATLSGRLPVKVEHDSVSLAGKTYPGSDLACLAVFPHPGGRRYVALLCGQTPDAICGASHLGLQLAPDFLVFDQQCVVDWGFFDNAWRHPQSSRVAADP